ncbi:MAG: MerR family transcriptional regulator, partial [Trueperaceae bacterium]
MSRGKFTVHEVEERTDVPAATLRQWERRYGCPKPERSTSGYRLYADVDLRVIETMKRYIDDGVPASRAADLVRGGGG